MQAPKPTIRPIRPPGANRGEFCPDPVPFVRRHGLRDSETHSGHSPASPRLGSLSLNPSPRPRADRNAREKESVLRRCERSDAQCRCRSFADTRVVELLSTKRSPGMDQMVLTKFSSVRTALAAAFWRSRRDRRSTSPLPDLEGSVAEDTNKGNPLRSGCGGDQTKLWSRAGSPLTPELSGQFMRPILRDQAGSGKRHGRLQCHVARDAAGHD